MSCTFYIKIFSILKRLTNILFHKFCCTATFFIGFINNLIIYICKVLNVVYIVTYCFKISSYCIKYDIWSSIPNMNEIINCWTTHIHTHLIFFNRFKGFFLFCKSVINFNHFSLPFLRNDLFYSFHILLFRCS